MLVMAAVAVLFLIMALGAFVDPRHFLRWFDLHAETATARNEIQAVYGGFGLAMTAVLLLPYAVPALKTGIAVAVGAALAGMALGRVIGLLRECPNGWALLFLGIEAAGAGALFAVAQ
jgi:hypothetical protein